MLCVLALATLALVPAAEAKSKRLLYDDMPEPPGGSALMFAPVCEGEDDPFYSFAGGGTADIAGDGELQAVRDGMALWSRVTNITFTESGFFADILSSWQTGSHGDGSSFDGTGGVLAHAFYPCSSPASDIHFDDDETWTTATRATGGQPIDLVTVAAHEVGHAIGLGHSDDPDALMYQFYSGSHRSLGWDDILGIQSFHPRQNGVYHLRNSSSAGGPDSSFLFQNLGDRPVAGDWNEDGTTTVGAYRPSNQTFYLRDSNSTGSSQYTFAYGNPGDLPVVGDWNASGTDTAGLYRPGNNSFYLKNTHSGGAADISFAFGNNEDIPVAGDWNEDGVDSVGVWRPSNQTWYLRNSNSTGTPDYSFVFGSAGDLPVVGDWNNSGTDTVGVYRPSTGMFYLRDTNSAGSADYAFKYGANLDDQVILNPLPVSGDWDGDGTPTVGLYQN